MKFVFVLTAVAILGCGTAAAADPPAAPSATPVKRPSLKVCNKQADAKNLTGPARAQFVRDCRAGKPAHGAERSHGAEPSHDAARPNGAVTS